MGMDVYGEEPTSEQGKYFRNNVWWWHPLAQYCEHVAPELAKRCASWHSNDGEGLNAEDSIELANILQAEVNANRTMQYEREWTDTTYPFTAENVIVFIAFLRDCGGFKI